MVINSVALFNSAERAIEIRNVLDVISCDVIVDIRVADGRPTSLIGGPIAGYLPYCASFASLQS